MGLAGTSQNQTRLINSYELIKWNIDKHYLRDLKNNGIQVVPTYFADRGNNISLQEIANLNDWKHIVIKPAISASAFNTYKITNDEIEQKEQLFHELLQTHDMLVQPFFPTISELGEASLMVFGGKFTHAILKKAKTGDFRVQDDFGGTVHDYNPTQEEIDFAEKVFQSCISMPIYGRVDIIWDTNKNLYLSELEIIEPELWIRNRPESAKKIADAVIKIL